MTVSNVINGRRDKVSAETLESVRRAVEQAGYVPNASARSLASSSSRIIALVYGAEPGCNALHTPYESLFVGACEEAARDAGFALMLCGATDVDETVSQLRSWKVAGAVVMATTAARPADLAARVDAPCVFVDAYEDLDVVSYVDIDDEGGARMVAREVTAAGHRRAVFVGPPTTSPLVAARLEGFRAGLAQAGAALTEDDVLCAKVRFDEGRRAARRLVESRSPATVVFASGNLLALGVVAGLRDAGVEVPGDVSVVGFDGLDISTYTLPPLTTVGQPVTEKAHTAVRYVVEGIGADDGPRGTILSVTWVAGGTLVAPRGRAAPPGAGRLEPVHEASRG